MRGRDGRPARPCRPQRHSQARTREAARPHPLPVKLRHCRASCWFDQRNRIDIVLAVDSKERQPSFEAGLAKLESIVESMETGEIPLAELLAKYEEGNKLLKLCEARLKEAELKIEQLKKQKDGVEFAPFDSEKGGA